MLHIAVIVYSNIPETSSPCDTWLNWRSCKSYSSGKTCHTQASCAKFLDVSNAAAYGAKTFSWLGKQISEVCVITWEFMCYLQLFCFSFSCITMFCDIFGVFMVSSRHFFKNLISLFRKRINIYDVCFCIYSCCSLSWTSCHNPCRQANGHCGDESCPG